MGDRHPVEGRDEHVIGAGEADRADGLERRLLGRFLAEFARLRLVDEAAHDPVGRLDDALHLAALLRHHLGAELDEGIAEAADDHRDRDDREKPELPGDGDFAGKAAAAAGRRAPGAGAGMQDGHRHSSDRERTSAAASGAESASQRCRRNPRRGINVRRWLTTR